MHKICKICQNMQYDPISISPMYSYAFICTKYAKIYKICKHESYMQICKNMHSPLCWYLGRPSFGEPGRFEKKEANITRPRDQETTNRDNENDRVSKLVLGIVTCFGICVGRSCSHPVGIALSQLVMANCLSRPLRASESFSPEIKEQVLDCAWVLRSKEAL